MYHKEGKTQDLQRTRRLLLLKYSWEVKTLTQLHQITGIPRAAMYRYFDDDPKLRAVVDARIAGKASPLTPEELLEGKSDEDMSEIPTVEEIAKSVLEPMQGMSKAIITGELPKVPPMKRRRVVVEVEPVRTVVTQSSDITDKIWKSEQVCELIANGQTTHQACEIIGIKQTNFGAWINPASPLYIKEIADLFTQAKNLYNQMMDEETQMLAKQSLKLLVEGRTIKLQTKIGRVDKEGKIKTTQIRETEKILEPHFAAVAKVLTTREAAKYGTPEERRLMADKSGTDNYELRVKTLEELDAEEAELLALLNGNKDENN